MSKVHTTAFNTLGAVDQWMKVISGNVTGATITGYKGTSVEFGEVLADQMRPGVRATEGYGSVNALQKADSGARITGTKTDFSQGTVTTTNVPTELAISGDAFFVVSRVPVPRTIEDLSFTRDGSFRFEFFPGPTDGSGVNRLVDKDGRFVMGYTSAVDTSRSFGTPVEESQGRSLSAFATKVPDGASGLTVNLQNIQLDHVRNPNAANNVSFDPAGILRVGGLPPKDLAGNDATMQVGLAKFANNQGLLRSSGGAYFDYHEVAGQIMVGGAANHGEGKVVGSSNVITAGALEQANTSINTVMPEITLAQKSFSATSKIISVGNTMIDDVNQLIR